MAKIKGILFDIGDTLIAATTLQNSALKAAVESLDWIKDKDTFLSAYDRADKHHSLTELPDLNHLYSDRRIVLLAFKLQKTAPSEGKADEFVQMYRRQLRKRIRPKPSLITVLKSLQGRKLLLGIVSNGTTKEQHEQLVRMHIRNYFDPIVISEDAGVRKPDPRILFAANEKWKLRSEEILVLGDRPDWECLAAARAGMKRGLTTQFIDHRSMITMETQPDIVIANLKELLTLI